MMQVTLWLSFPEKKLKFQTRINTIGHGSEEQWLALPTDATLNQAG